MPVSQSYLEYVLDQVNQVAPVTSKKMFGGVSLYVQGKIFAVIDDDQTFFKVNEATRTDYETAGMSAWSPTDNVVMRGYYALPENVLDDVSELRDWMRKAIVVATTSPPKRKPKPAKKKTP